MFGIALDTTEKAVGDDFQLYARNNENACRG